MEEKKVVIRDVEPQAEPVKQASQSEATDEAGKRKQEPTKENKQVNAFDSTNLTVEGFQFYTVEDVEIAKEEQKKIEYLTKRLNFNNPTSVHQVYEKMVQERVFKTPLGLNFLKRVQNYLKENPAIDNSRISPIALNVAFNGGIRTQGNRTRQRIQPSKKKDKKVPILAVSIILNLMLVVTVIAMFAIAVTADEPNILNYERALTNRYASWEQELTAREQVVREKERELQIEVE